jgi:hypothetical protein
MSLLLQPSYQRKRAAAEVTSKTGITAVRPIEEKPGISIPPLTLLAASAVGGMMWAALIYGVYLLVRLFAG